MKKIKKERNTLGFRVLLDKEIWDAMSREARIEGLTVSHIFEAVLLANMEKFAKVAPDENSQFRCMSIRRPTKKKLAELAKKHKVKEAEIVRQVIDLALRK